MFGARLGGLEQVFVDYSEALATRGHAMVNFVAPGAESAPSLRALGQRGGRRSAISTNGTRSRSIGFAARSSKVARRSSSRMAIGRSI